MHTTPRNLAEVSTRKFRPAPANRSQPQPTGTIADTRPLTITGRRNCDQVNTTCDYFAGDLDHLKIETS